MILIRDNILLGERRGGLQILQIFSTADFDQEKPTTHFFTSAQLSFFPLKPLNSIGNNQTLFSFFGEKLATFFFSVFLGETMFAKSRRRTLIQIKSHAILLQWKCNIYAKCSQDLTKALALV